MLGGARINMSMSLLLDVISQLCSGITSSSLCNIQATRLNSGGFPQLDDGAVPSPASGSPQDVLLSTPSNNFDMTLDGAAAMSGRCALSPIEKTARCRHIVQNDLQRWHLLMSLRDVL